MTDFTKLHIGPARLKMADGNRIEVTVLGLADAFNALRVRLATGTEAALSFGDIRYAVQVR